jgi:hypothetical protein
MHRVTEVDRGLGGGHGPGKGQGARRGSRNPDQREEIATSYGVVGLGLLGHSLSSCGASFRIATEAHHAAEVSRIDR